MSTLEVLEMAARGLSKDDAEYLFAEGIYSPWRRPPIN